MERIKQTQELCTLTPRPKYINALKKRESFLEGWLQLQGLLNGEVFTCHFKDEKETRKLMVVKFLPWCASLYLKPMECDMQDQQEQCEQQLATAQNHRYNGGQLWSLHRVQVRPGQNQFSQGSLELWREGCLLF